MSEWYVITGGPSSGKTTLINELAKVGYYTVPETARFLIDKERTDGKPLEEIRGDEREFQRKVFKMRIDVEDKLPKDKIVFLDRALPDCIAYYEVLGVDTKELIEACKKRRYKKVFLLEQLPYKKDYARVENKELANKLNDIIYKTYSKLGYEVVRIPPMSVKDRLKVVLSHIKES